MLFDMYDKKQFVDADYLDEDELDYELIIRQEYDALRKDIPTKRHRVRVAVKAEEEDPCLFPHFVEGDLEREMETCANKLAALSIFCQDQNNKRIRNYERKVDSKLNHIEQRVRRVSHTNSSYEQRTNQLVAVVGEIRRHLLGPTTNANAHQQEDVNEQPIPEIMVSNQQPVKQVTTQLEKTHDVNRGQQGSQINLNDQQPPWGRSFGSEVPVEIALEMESLRRKISELEFERGIDRNSREIPRRSTLQFQQPVQPNHHLQVPVNPPVIQTSLPNMWSYRNNRQHQQFSPNNDYFSEPNQRFRPNSDYFPESNQRFQQNNDYVARPNNQNPGNEQYYARQNQQFIRPHQPDRFQYPYHQDQGFQQQRSREPDTFGGRVSEDRDQHKTLPVSRWGLTFSGEGKTANLQDFLTRVKVLAKAERCSDDELRRSAYHLLSGPAREWYVAFEDDFETWDDLVAELKLYYLSPRNDITVRRYIDGRRQKGYEPFLTYLADMEQNYKKLSYTVPVYEKVQTIKDGLNPYFAEKLVLLEVRTMEDLKKCCRRIEALSAIQYNRPETNPIRQRFEPTRRVSELYCDANYHDIAITQPEFQPQYDPEQIAALTAPNTNKTPIRTQTSGCQTDEIPQRQSNYTEKPGMRCFNCNDYGHHRNVCPKSKGAVYCYRCGQPNVILPNCTHCNLTGNPGNGARGAEGGTVSHQ
jgi:hypothetical protein